MDKRIFMKSLLGAAVPLVVPASAPVLAQGLPAPQVLRLAANPNLSAIELLNNFGPFARELEAELGVPVRLVAGRDYEDTLRLLRAGQVDIAGTGAFGYVSAHDSFGARLLVRYVEDDGDSYHAIIFVRKDSGITSLPQLRGKRFAFTDVKSTSGYLLPVLELARQGVQLADLGKVEHVKKQPNAAIAVYNRLSDAGAMADNQLTEKYSVKIDELRILWSSPPIPHGVWIARPDMSDAELARTSQAILRISRSPQGRKALAAASVRGFAEARDSDFEAVRAAARQFEKLGVGKRP